jgi:hypothetical protein
VGGRCGSRVLPVQHVRGSRRHPRGHLVLRPSTAEWLVVWRVIGNRNRTSHRISPGIERRQHQLVHRYSGIPVRGGGGGAGGARGHQYGHRYGYGDGDDRRRLVRWHR